MSLASSPLSMNYIDVAHRPLSVNAPLSMSAPMSRDTAVVGETLVVVKSELPARGSNHHCFPAMLSISWKKV